MIDNGDQLGGTAVMRIDHLRDSNYKIFIRFIHGVINGSERHRRTQCPSRNDDGDGGSDIVAAVGRNICVDQGDCDWHSTGDGQRRCDQTLIPFSHHAGC